MKLPTVSVLIPTQLNRLSISKTFASLYEQTHKPDRIIMQIKTNSPYDYLSKPNEMIRDCGTETFLMLPDDDYLAPDFLEKTLNKMSQGYDLVYTGMQKFGYMNDYVSPRRWGKFKTVNACWFTTLCKKEVWEKLGGFDESMGKCLDWDFWWRAYKAGFKAATIDKPLLYYCLHEGQDSRVADGAMEESIKKVKAKNL